MSIVTALPSSPSASYNPIPYTILSVAETRDRALGFSREVEFVRWFPVAFLTGGISIVTHGGIELTTPVLWVRMLNHCVTAPLVSIVLTVKYKYRAWSRLFDVYNSLIHMEWVNSENSRAERGMERTVELLFM